MSSVSRCPSIRALIRTIGCLLLGGLSPLFCRAATPVPGSSPAAITSEARGIQLERLQRYAFASNKRDDKAPGFLLGNARLGGCVAASGLGIPALWGAELWQNADKRLALKGMMLSCAALDGLTPVSYQQEVALRDGLAKTTVRYAGDVGYDTELFCSMSDPSLLVIRLTPQGAIAKEWRLDIPLAGDPEQRSPQLLAGKSALDAFTPFTWTLNSDRPLTPAATGGFTVQLAPAQSLTLSLRLQSGAPDPVAAGPVPTDFAGLLARHRSAWDGLWQRCAVLALPDARIERLWYRSLYWTLSTCGNRRYLPGESMFVVPCWDMHAFSYGAAGWATQAFTAVGLPERAKAMLDWHLKPEAMRNNAQFYTQAFTQTAAAPEAMAFAHEVKNDGNHIPCGHWELQRHLDGFAAALFYRHQRFYPNQSVTPAELYPLMKGLAEFWCGIAKRDTPEGDYLVPQMTSLTEDLIARHPIDAALAAKWCLLMAYRDAVALNRDAARRDQWREVADHLLIPQNDQRYLEYAGDLGQRPGGGYQGVRGFVYLGWPTTELIPTFDRTKALGTLEHTWERNRKGEGMIGFVANWFALADLHYGRGDHALAILKHNFLCEDVWGQGVSETPGSGNYHFTTNYSSYLLVPLAMVVQSVNSRLQVFSGVPSEWKDFAFYQVPAESGMRVSGVMRDGEVRWVSYTREGKLLRQSNRREALLIQQNGNAVSLKEDKTGASGK
jgi:hypothetical protein